MLSLSSFHLRRVADEYKINMGKIFKHTRAKSNPQPLQPIQPYPGSMDTENFIFLSPYSNLDLYPGMDHPPYFDMRSHPTMLDVVMVKNHLSKRLPTEIIDMILDLSSYWPHTTSTLDITTRVYTDHMNYGSYGRGPKTWWHNRPSTPEMRREWREEGFVLRTPPLGLRCVQSDDPRKGYVRSLRSPFKNRSKKGAEKVIDWLPPRGKHPARMVLFEILSREERATDHFNALGFRSDSKTSFEARIDNIAPPMGIPFSDHEPLHWTTEAATTKSYQRVAFDPKLRERQYIFRPRQSSSGNSHLRQAFPVSWNRTAQNRKCVLSYAHNDTSPYSAEKGRFLSADIVRGFVHSLKEGDSISLWARAWEGVGPCCNVVDRVKIHVFWAV